MISKQQLEQLTQEAKKLGATSAAIVSSKEIQVKDNFDDKQDICETHAAQLLNEV